MIDAFVDATVLFAASYSSTGGSREIVRLAIRGDVQLVISDDVLDEAERNLGAKYPATVDVLHLIVDSTPFENVAPSADEVRKAAHYTASKDAHVVAAAVAAEVEYLVTLDRKHLLNKPDVARRSGLKIVTPGDLLEEIRRQESG